jgi:MFS superfamily sulfate permease-like transporter
MWHQGLDQFIPFVVTIVAVILTDLLIGVGIGMLVGVFYILRTNLRNPYFYPLHQTAKKSYPHKAGRRGILFKQGCYTGNLNQLAKRQRCGY